MRQPMTPMAMPKAIEMTASTLCTALNAKSWAGSLTMFQIRVVQT